MLQNIQSYCFDPLGSLFNDLRGAEFLLKVLFLLICKIPGDLVVEPVQKILLDPLFHEPRLIDQGKNNTIRLRFGYRIGINNPSELPLTRFFPLHQRRTCKPDLTGLW